MRSARKLQLDLRLDAALPDAKPRWQDGAPIPWLGNHLHLTLSGTHPEVAHVGNRLHLPLPPQATPRQIQDRTEAWLREQAACHLTRLLAEKSALAGRRPPRLALSFARRGHWIEAQDADTVRCHWRLIEQPAAVIAQAMERALAALPPAQSGADLFAAADN